MDVPMFLIRDSEHDSLVFTAVRPNLDDVPDDRCTEVRLVRLDNPNSAQRWLDGAESPSVCLGRHPTIDTHYAEFRSNRDRENAGFLPLGVNFAIRDTWEDYRSAFE
jgi:hypothetical protein